VEAPHEADIDPGIAALSALVGRAPSAQPVSPAPAPAPHRAAPPEPPRSTPTPPPAPAAAAQPTGPYFTIQVGSFQDPANAASLVRSLGAKGWEAFVVDWATAPDRSGRLSG
jgi:cell division septation protein DedD